MFHYLFLIGYGLFLGLGAAMPIGPVNLEIIRRNINTGFFSGLCLGLGASCTDLSYLTLLSLGLLNITQHPITMSIIALVGALILMGFALQAIRTSQTFVDTKPKINTIQKRPWRHILDGYLMTLINPMTVLFWSSVSTQIILLANQGLKAMGFIAGGVILGAFGWAVALNIVLHYTRHYFSDQTLKRINLLGAMMLIAFAFLGLWHGLYPLI